MKKLMLTLADGDHIVSTPTFYALQLMSEYGVDLLAGDVAATPSAISSVLAALMTDSEPVDARGIPLVIWEPVQVAKLMTIADMGVYVELMTDLIADAMPESQGATSPNPKPE